MTDRRREELVWTRRNLIRTFGVAAGALVSVPLLTRPSFAQVSFADDPYSLGIAAGDPSPDGFVIWTRLAPKPFEIGFGMDTRPVEVTWEVASDEKFATIVQSGVATASPLLAHTVHVEVAGLHLPGPTGIASARAAHRARPARPGRHRPQAPPYRACALRSAAARTMRAVCSRHTGTSPPRIRISSSAMATTSTRMADGQRLRRTDSRNQRPGSGGWVRL
jgi:hypothetical protein